MTVLLFIAVIPALRASTDLQAAPVLVIGVFLGSILWWTILSMATALIRTRLSVGAVALTNRASGLTLVALGTLMLIKAFEQTLP
jgi:small neutral amino acid transporter SnatA (MarC family)